jgi:hypothetical protein
MSGVTAPSSEIEKGAKEKLALKVSLRDCTQSQVLSQGSTA